MTESDRAAGGGTAGSSPGAGLDGAIESVEREFSTLFVKLRNRMRAQALQLHPEIQPAGYLMLTTLSRSGPMHAGALAEVLYADKSLVSRQASQLEQLGLLRREQDPADRRATYFALTDEAQKRLKQLFERNREELRSGLSGWDVEELRLFARLLHRLNEF